MVGMIIVTALFVLFISAVVKLFDEYPPQGTIPHGARRSMKKLTKF